MGASAPPMDDFTSPYTGLNLRDDGGGFAGTTSKPYPYVPSSKFPLTEAFFTSTSTLNRATSCNNESALRWCSSFSSRLFSSSSSSARTAPRSSLSELSDAFKSFDAFGKSFGASFESIARTGSAGSPLRNRATAKFKSSISIKKASCPCGESMAYISACGISCASSLCRENGYSTSDVIPTTKVRCVSRRSTSSYAPLPRATSWESRV
mmetsp:Transcript_4409/g.14695  ORF Transcript_4409/g.14695 Transcript_4409/m.14695 type:complete len:209 (-) Transcript_4409:1201-1827(-)